MGEQQLAKTGISSTKNAIEKRKNFMKAEQSTQSQTMELDTF